MKTAVLLLLSVSAPGLATNARASAESWTLAQSTVTYTVNHPLKTASGTSKASKGKGRCEKGHCSFLIAAPVRSFDSGDSNRDLHMLEVTHGAAFPMVVVRTAFEEKTLERKPAPFDLEIEFAGKKATYRAVPFETLVREPRAIHLKGAVTIKLSDFAIEPPSLLTLPIKDDVPIAIDSYWTAD